MKRMILLLAALWLAVMPAAAERLTDAALLSYYGDAMFVGDSIMDMFRAYVYRQRQEDADFLRDSHFFSATSYRLDSASYTTVRTGSIVNLTWSGKPVTMLYLVELRKPDKLLILLGVNDYIGTNIPWGMECVERIVTRVGKVSPETRLYFFSLTPVTKKFCRKVDYQPLWDAYNAALEARCAELGVAYIEIADRLKNEEGYLSADYTSDNEFHLNSAGNALWVEALCDFAQAQYEAGLWAPEGRERLPETMPEATPVATTQPGGLVLIRLPDTNQP